MSRFTRWATTSAAVTTRIGLHAHGLAWFLLGCILVAHGIWWYLAMLLPLTLVADYVDQWADDRTPVHPWVQGGDVVGEYKVRRVVRAWWRA